MITWSHDNLACNIKMDDPKLLAAVASHLCRVEGCEKDRHWNNRIIRIKIYKWIVKNENQLYRLWSYTPSRNGVKLKEVTKEEKTGNLFDAGVQRVAIDPTRTVDDERNWRTFFLPYDGLK